MELLLQGKSPPAVAAEVGVSRTSVWRWTQEPDFASKLSSTREDRRQAIAAGLDLAACDAVRVLHEVMTDERQPGAVRVRAASELLDRAGVTAKAAADEPETAAKTLNMIEFVKQIEQAEVEAAKINASVTFDSFDCRRTSQPEDLD